MNFEDREVQHPNRVKLKQVREETDGIVYDIERTEGDIKKAGTPLSAEKLNTLAPKADPSFTGTIKSGNREIGQIVFGYGQIAKQFSHTAITNSTRFTAYITATFLGNRKWRISGSGFCIGNEWDNGFLINGIGFSNLGLILFNDGDFFSSTGQVHNGKFIKVLTNGTVNFNGDVNNIMGIGTCIFMYPDRAGLSRDYNNGGGFGVWTNSIGFGSPAYIDFEFVLLAAKD